MKHVLRSALAAGASDLLLEPREFCLPLAAAQWPRIIVALLVSDGERDVHRAALEVDALDQMPDYFHGNPFRTR